jgi:hypothetical protein
MESKDDDDDDDGVTHEIVGIPMRTMAVLRSA